METIEERFSKAIEILTEKGIAQSKADVAKTLGLTKQVLTDITNGRNKVKNTTLSLFCKIYQINLDWLFFEEGDMFKSAQPQQPQSDRYKAELSELKQMVHLLSNKLDALGA